MISSVRRAAFAAVVGALVASLSLVAAYVIHPGLVFEMDKPLPSFINGVHGNERDDRNSFVWTKGVVTANIPGIDRQVEWTCTMRFRGARAEGQPQPFVTVTVDGQVAGRMPATNEFYEWGIRIPPDSGTGTSIVIVSAPTFTPGTADKRELGIQIDRFICRPSADFVRPPSNALAQASIAAAIFAAGLALVGLSLSSAMFAAAVVALGQTVMLALASGIYGDLPARLPWIAFWIMLPTVLLARGLELARREPLSSSARFVFTVSASALMLKLIGLYHPAKPVIDSVFNAHRLEAVLAGHFTFTQPMPDGVQFPYAVGLYVFTSLFAWITTNHVALIWTVTAAADVAAAALLYPVIIRAWGDRRAGAMAVALYLLIPLLYTVLGNANMPNMFGQSLSLVTMAAAATWRLEPRRYWTLAGFTAILTWALCTHVSTVTMLPMLLGVLAVLYYWRGDADRRRAAVAIVIATFTAVVAAWLIYWRHFMDVYRVAFDRMFADKLSQQAIETGVVKGEMSMAGRLWDLVQQAVTNAGLPLLILAAFGAWAIVRRRTRDRLMSALAAWAVLWLVFSLSTVFARVDREFIRYAAEYLGRINLATVPLLAILAGKGASLPWESDAPQSLRRPLQFVAAALVAWALILALNEWVYWFRR